MLWLVILQFFWVSINPMTHPSSGALFSVREFDKILPKQALKVYTESAEGSVKRQSVVSNETEAVLEKDRQFVRIEEIRNPSDVFNRTELYVVFPAEKIDGLPGYYIIVIAPKPRLKEDISYFQLDCVHLVKSKGIQLVMSVKTNWKINTWFYYSRNPQIEKEWGASEVNGNILKSTEVVNAVRFLNKFIDDMPTEFADGRWHDNITLAIDPMFSRQGRILYLSWDLVQRLDHMFAEKGKAFHWKKDTLAQEKMAEVLRAFAAAQDEKNIDVDVYIRIKFDKQEVSIGSRRVATLEKTIAVQMSSGAVIPGYLTIGVTIKKSK